nr:unnamed protein product [Callosobruchus chinensis]
MYNTSPTEIKQFIALELIMGVVSMPSLDDYWAVNTRYSLVADVMPVKRFKKLRRLIHFQDNNAEPNGDRFFKIRPLLEKIRENCNKTEDEELYSIDEMMILYKGTKAGNLRQYMPKNPRNGASKCLCVLGCRVLCMTFSCMQEEGLGSSGKVVAHLCKTIPHPETSIVYFDNWFCSLELITLLKNSYNINSLGTIRSNRLRNCTLENDKSLLQKGRGSYDYMNDNNIGIAVVRWADTKCVTLASSFVSYSPVVSVKRYSKEEKKKVDVDCPQIIKQYNTHMGGVDLADMLIALYKVPLKSKRWYLGIFGQLIDICANNAWLLYQSLLKGNSLAKLRKSDLANDQPSKKIRVPVSVRPTQDVRYDQIGHFPTFGEKGRCKLCTNGQTSVFCEKCCLRLCIVPGKNSRNCFTIYHMK